MKIVYLTAGAAGMYCGSCMHDNTLAKAISKEGVDIELVPTYTPIRTDENDVSVDQVFFGGINVYLQQKIPLLRMLPKFFDRFLDNPWLIRRVTKNASKVSPTELGKLAYSMLKGEKGNQRKEVKRLLNWLEHKSKPDVVLFSNALIGGCIPAIQQKLNIPCFVTLQGDDIFLDSLPEKYKKLCIERIGAIQGSIAKFISHSEFYADFMSDYFSISRDQIAITLLGIEADDFSQSKPETQAGGPTIGYFARLAPEKGLDILVDAFIKLRSSEVVPQAKLKIGGWLGPTNEAYANEQFDKLQKAGLDSEYEYVGSIDRDSKIEFFHSLDVLSVPTTYEEPKGLFVLEAMASGIPVVQPNHGAFPEVISSTKGGVLFPAGNSDALASELAKLLNDTEKHRGLSAAGYESVHKNRNSRVMARSTLEVLKSEILPNSN